MTDEESAETGTPTGVTLSFILRRRHPEVLQGTLRRWVAEGRVKIGEARARTFHQVVPDGQSVVVSDHGPKKIAEMKGTGAGGGLRIVHEDNDILVADKPPGLVTVSMPGDPRPTLVRLVRKHVGEQVQLGIIHRLDKDVGGLIVFSKSDAGFKGLKEQLKLRTLKREYVAVVKGVPTPQGGGWGKWDWPIFEPKDGPVQVVKGGGGRMTAGMTADPATTEFKVVVQGQGGERSMLEIRLETGRKHQIRAHCATAGHAILGDPIYGRVPLNRPPLLLMATRMGLVHPVSREALEFSLEVPNRFRSIVGQELG